MVNTLQDLIGDAILFEESEYNSLTQEMSELRKRFPEAEFYYDGVYIHIVPYINSKIALDFLDKVSWIVIESTPDAPHCFRHYLRSDFTQEEGIAFLEKLRKITYYPAYEREHLQGTIFLKDGSWLSRDFVNGFEEWVSHSVPQEPIQTSWAL